MEILKKIKKVDWNNTNSAIEFYETHKLFFENDQVFVDDYTIREIASIKVMYGEALFERSYYEEVLPIVEQTKILLERLNEEYYGYVHLYERTRFLEARTLYRIKKYIQAAKIFKELVELDSNNYNYRDWYHSSIVQYSDSILIAAGIIAVLFFALDIYTVIRDIESMNFNLIGMTIIVVSFLTHYSIKYYFKLKLNLN